MNGMHVHITTGYWIWELAVLYIYMCVHLESQCCWMLVNSTPQQFSLHLHTFKLKSYSLTLSLLCVNDFESKLKNSSEWDLVRLFPKPLLIGCYKILHRPAVSCSNNHIKGSASEVGWWGLARSAFMLCVVRTMCHICVTSYTPSWWNGLSFVCTVCCSVHVFPLFKIHTNKNNHRKSCESICCDIEYSYKTCSV